MQEEWRDIRDYEGLYQISNNGVVKENTRLVEVLNGNIINFMFLNKIKN